MQQRPRAISGSIGRAALVLLLAVVASATASAQAILYRIFLTDGSTLVTYGDYARVAGRVVFSIPIGGLDTAAPRLELVSIQEDTVDWEKTQQYAEAARAQNYAETRGERDFARLSAEVALALNQIALTEDPARRVAIAENARRALSDWPSKNYYYRANDVTQLSGLLDEVISELRVAAGMDRFDLAFVANTAPPPSIPLLPRPSLRESIEQALTVSHATPEPAERIALLEAVVGSLAASGNGGEEGWAGALHARASAELLAERKIERAYAELSATTLAAADERLRNADVRGIESLVRSALDADDRLGRRRPQAMSALLGTLDFRLNRARQFRLARDAWTSRHGAVRSYQRRIRGPVGAFRRSSEALKDIRQLAGPAPESLARLSASIAQSARDLARISPSTELKPIHGMLVTAVQMAGRAVAARQSAVTTADMDVAWQASSAAAGALMMFDRAIEELKRLATPPRL